MAQEIYDRQTIWNSNARCWRKATNMEKSGSEGERPGNVRLGHASNDWGFRWGRRVRIGDVKATCLLVLSPLCCVCGVPGSFFSRWRHHDAVRPTLSGCDLSELDDLVFAFTPLGW